MTETRFLGVGTYHKSGTVWMQKVFKAYARKSNGGFFNESRHVREANWAGETAAPPENLATGTIIFDGHCRFTLLGDQIGKGFRVVRDPRAIAVSAAAYHERAKEPWLKIPRPEYDGMSYQEKINSLPDRRARIQFEMRKTAKRVIRSMLDFGRPGFLTIRYEDLIVDNDFAFWTQIMDHLGIAERKVFETVVRNNSFNFDKKAETSSHATSSGGPDAWREKFDDDLMAEFASLHPTVLDELGYKA